MDLEKYKKAVQFVVSDRLASTSFIQRKLQIGYNTAAAIMEKMEDDGIVSAANHIGKRDILVSDDFVLAESSSPVHGGESKPVETEGAKPKTYTGPIIRFTCSGCDVTANGPSDGLPTGWYEQQTARIGIVHRCPKCAEKNAVKIATSTMTTAEILNYDGGPSGTDVIAGAAQTRLKSYVERLNRLFDDLVALSEDIKEVKAEANGEGFDTKILTKVVRASRIDKVKRQEEQAIFDMYAQAAGLE